MYSENDKMLMKEIKDDTNRWRDTPCSWINQYCQNDYTTPGNLQIQCNPYQSTKDIFHRTRTKYFKVCLEAQRPRIAKAMMRKKNGAGESGSLTSDYTAKQQLSKPYGTGTKTEI